jgi:hypothetical protein
MSVGQDAINQLPAFALAHLLIRVLNSIFRQADSHLDDSLFKRLAHRCLPF